MILWLQLSDSYRKLTDNNPLNRFLSRTRLSSIKFRTNYRSYLLTILYDNIFYIFISHCLTYLNKKLKADPYNCIRFWKNELKLSIILFIILSVNIIFIIDSFCFLLLKFYSRKDAYESWSMRYYSNNHITVLMNNIKAPDIIMKIPVNIL